MATVTDNPYLVGTDPDWLKVWKQYNPDDKTGDVAVGPTGLMTLHEQSDTTGVPGTPADVTGWVGTGNWAPGSAPGNIVTSPGRPPARGPVWGPSISWAPTTKATSELADPTISAGPTFFRPNLPGGTAPIFVLPQQPDPNDSNKTHYFTGAPIYWDPSEVTGGTMSPTGTFQPTGGEVHGLGKALRLQTTPLGPAMDSGYVLPAGYKEAIASGGPAAAVDFLQSGPRGADGLTDAQRALVSQIKAPRVGPARGANQFQELLDAYGASPTPTGTSVAGNKVTMPGGVGWRGGAPSTGGPQGIRGNPVGFNVNAKTWKDYEAQRRAYVNARKKAG
jgi:hypothetical protein